MKRSSEIWTLYTHLRVHGRKTEMIHWKEAEPLRILLITPLQAFGGSERAMYDIYQFLSQSKVQLHIASTDGPMEGSDWKRRIEALAQEVLYIKPDKSSVMNQMFYPKQLLQLSQRIKPHVVQCMGTVSGYQALPAFLGSSPRPLLTCWLHSDFPVFLWYVKKLVRVLDLSFVVNEALRRRLQSFKISDDRICLLPNGADPTHFVPLTSPKILGELREKYQIDRPFVVAWVGRLHPEKDPFSFVKLAQLIIKDRGDVIFLLVGDGPLYGSLQDTITAEKLDKQVRILGFVEDTREIYAISDAIVLTSPSEGAPLAVLEAMTMRKAVIATQVGGIPEAIQHDYNGILFGYGEWRRAADQIGRLLNDRALRIQLGTRARETILVNRDIRKTAKQMYTQLTRALS